MSLFYYGKLSDALQKILGKFPIFHFLICSYAVKLWFQSEIWPKDVEYTLVDICNRQISAVLECGITIPTLEFKLFSVKNTFYSLSKHLFYILFGLCTSLKKKKKLSIPFSPLFHFLCKQFSQRLEFCSELIFFFFFFFPLRVSLFSKGVEHVSRNLTHAELPSRHEHTEKSQWV